MRRLLAVSFPVLLLLAPSPGRAATPGSLSGVVRTSDANPVPHVPVVVAGASALVRVTTGPQGQYRVTGLLPGEYALRVEAPGFVLASPTSVTVGSDEVRLDLSLAPAPVREHLVVSATRGPALPSTLGVSASVVGAERVGARQAATLLDLLPELAGVATSRAGGVGAQASAFVRGGASNATRILVDGVAVNQPGGAYDFGSDLPLEVERVELVRGAASSLYGSDALAGVVHVATRRAGPDAPSDLRASLEGGGFAWRRAEGGGSGRAGRFDWNAGLVRLETDNEQPNSAFEQTALAASLGFDTTEQSSLRLVLRGADSRTGTPGPTAFGRPDLDAFIERRDAVASLQYRVTGARLSHELQLLASASDALSANPLDSGTYVPGHGDRAGAYPVLDFPDPEGFQNDVRRLGFAYQAQASVGGGHLLSAGLDVERETGEIGSRPEALLTPARGNAGGWLQGRFLLGARLFATLGGRVERNASYGTEAVPRAALAFRLRDGRDSTILRASAGAGIKEPSFLESFGVSFYAQGNPDLKPERSRSFDAGVEQRLLGDRLRAQVTLFDHDYRDQVAYQVTDYATFQGSFVNLGHTRARGLEVEVEVSPTQALRVWGQYTLLDGEILTSTSAFFDPVLAPGRPLLRRPKHQGSLAVGYAAGRLTLGSSLRLVGRRADSDFLGLGLEEAEGYARWDARARVALGAGFEALLAVDNLLGAAYQEALGYPALGRSVRVGLRFASGGGKRP